MKTNTYNMETKIMKTGMLLALFMIMGFGVFAAEKNKSGTNTLEASSDSEQSVTKAGNSIPAISFDLGKVIEEQPVIEDWVIDLNDESWNVVVEEKIPLEKWMYDLTDERWSGTRDQEEENIPLEPWMYDISQWKAR